jgi:hypothetical protein
MPMYAVIRVFGEDGSFKPVEKYFDAIENQSRTLGIQCDFCYNGESSLLRDVHGEREIVPAHGEMRVRARKFEDITYLINKLPCDGITNVELMNSGSKKDQVFK